LFRFVPVSLWAPQLKNQPVFFSQTHDTWVFSQKKRRFSPLFLFPFPHPPPRFSLNRTHTPGKKTTHTSAPPCFIERDQGVGPFLVPKLRPFHPPPFGWPMYATLKTPFSFSSSLLLVDSALSQLLHFFWNIVRAPPFAHFRRCIYLPPFH